MFSSRVRRFFAADEIGFPRVLVVLTLSATLGLCLITALVMKNLHDDAWRSAKQQSWNVVHLIERDMTLNLEIIDLSLQGVLAELRRPDFDTLPLDLRRAMMFDRASGARHIGAVFVLNEDGNVVYESVSPTPRSENYAERESFRHHRESTSPDLFVSTPYASSRTGEMVIALSRRIARADGSFGGVVFASLQLSYFKSVLQQLTLGANDVVSALRQDGRMLMRQPYDPADLGRSVAAGEPYKRFATSPVGTFVGTSVIDGTRRLYSFAHATGFPVIVVAAVAVDDIFAEWSGKAMAIGPVVALLSFLSLALTVRLAAVLRSRTRAEEQVRRANVELAALAITDPLTGLANRRHFDDMLNREWRRSLREGRDLSLLLIDADNFKAFNDTYGHMQGDRVLKMIAGALADQTREAVDVTSRIGGEEFTVILSGVGLPDATATAERIRRAVLARAVPHARSECGAVSISVGVASRRASGATDPQGLLASADEALYEAKRGGRNRVRSRRVPRGPAETWDAAA